MYSLLIYVLLILFFGVYFFVKIALPNWGKEECVDGVASVVVVAIVKEIASNYEFYQWTIAKFV